MIHHIYKMKDKNHMLISIDEKKFEKIEHPFLVKILKVGVEGIYLNIIKVIYIYQVWFSQVALVVKNLPAPTPAKKKERSYQCRS